MIIPMTADLAYWISERYTIKLRKEAGEPPNLAAGWTADPVMGRVRYCNVHREDDAVTKWMRQNWNQPLDPAWKFVLGRMINLPESLADMKRAMEDQHTTDPIEEAKAALKSRRATGEKVFTSVYTISTCGKSMDKIDYVFDWVVARVRAAGDGFLDNSLARYHDHLTSIDGLGSFLSGQVIADMKNTIGHPLASADDFWTWSTPGPGSLRGLSWYHTGTPDGVTVSQYATLLKSCRRDVDPLIPSYIPRISDQDFQNCLCEFSKYCKVRFLNGHVRNRYDPRSKK